MYIQDSGAQVGKSDTVLRLVTGAVSWRVIKASANRRASLSVLGTDKPFFFFLALVANPPWWVPGRGRRHLVDNGLNYYILTGARAISFWLSGQQTGCGLKRGDVSFCGRRRHGGGGRRGNYVCM